MKKKHITGILALSTLSSFVIWTILLCHIDMQTIGPHSSRVAFATLNRLFHELTGVHMSLYVLTDWLGLVPVFIGFIFATMGLYQWIHRKKLLKVDVSLLILGVFYLVVIAFYLFFETVIINYRPVLINGILEPSYPSSTTILTFCVMPTAIFQINDRIKRPFLRHFLVWTSCIFTAFMVIGRLISGVHWLTDIIGGILLSAGLVLLYARFAHSKHP